jgi:hypothetical protein
LGVAQIKELLLYVVAVEVGAAASHASINHKYTSFDIEES